MTDYRVLARKYRPQSFDDLVGQDVLVRTLSNAISTGRIAHAFLLTGIRGIGKTTTARIIARALNCIGEDGKGEATITPCGVCPNCVQIREDRHVDVLEMDAASRTGVGDIRDLIETIHYAPTNARYKIYIIDEVHMLSTSAFNALLKTLEEPPPNVIFIFATTEIRKIPVTILSRCQRFDLKRLDMEQLANHLANICKKEEVTAEPEGLRLIAMAAEGSVRDALSLLDQAIAHSLDKEQDQTTITTETIRSMLGLADRSRIFELLKNLFKGNINEALESLHAQYQDGIDLVMLLQDMMATTHSMTRLHLAPEMDLGPTYSETEKTLASEMAKELNIPELTRFWQMMQKGMDELKQASNNKTTMEMLLIRMAYAARLPGPGEVIKKLQKQDQNTTSTPSPVSQVTLPNNNPPTTTSHANTATATATAPAPQTEPVAYQPPTHLSLAAHNPVISISTFEEMLELCEEQREPKLLHHLQYTARLVSCEKQTLTLNEATPLPTDIQKNLLKFLDHKTNQKWKINYTNESGNHTIAEQKEIERKKAFDEAKQHPDIQAILTTFQGSEITNIETKQGVKA